MIYSTPQAIEALSINPNASFSLIEGGLKYILDVDGTNIIQCHREDFKGGRPIFIDDEWLKEDESNA